MAGTPREAWANLEAGERLPAGGLAPEAELAYKAAEKADASYTMLHVRLAQLYQAQGRDKDARIRYERALRVDPEDLAARQALNSLFAAAPQQRVEVDRDQRAAEDRFVARINPQAGPVPLRAGEKQVRVGLLDSAPRFRLKLGGDYVVEGLGLTLPAHSAWQAALGATGGWELRPLSGAAKPLNFSQVTRLLPLQAGSTFGVYDVDNGAGYFWAGKEDRYYRGVLELRPQGAQGLTLVNELGLEAYLCSVVPSEMPPYWEGAALQAQAIAARTDTLRNLGRFKGKGYDLCPTVACAVYAGVGAEDPRSSAAVSATAGTVLEGPGGRLHPTFYMHNSGGHTQEPREAWSFGEKAPPMAVVDSPPGSGDAKLFPLTPAGLLRFVDNLDGGLHSWPKDSSTFRWTLRLSAAEAGASVGRRHPAVGPLQRVEVVERTEGGYARRVRFAGLAGESIGSSDYIRTALKGMKSNLFYVESRRGPDGKLEALLLHGGGWGHGVGMAQAGARAMAKAGLDSSAILQHYFPQSSLATR
jgi:stage II sporulation protein D